MNDVQAALAASWSNGGFWSLVDGLFCPLLPVLAGCQVFKRWCGVVPLLEHPLFNDQGPPIKPWSSPILPFINPGRFQGQIPKLKLAWHSRTPQSHLLGTPAVTHHDLRQDETQECNAPRTFTSKSPKCHSRVESNLPRPKLSSHLMSRARTPMSFSSARPQRWRFET